MEYYGFLQIFRITGDNWVHLRLISQSNSEDVASPMRVQNRRCSCGFFNTVITFALIVFKTVLKTV